MTTNREKIVAAKPQPDQELLKTLPLSRLDDVYAGENFPIFDDWLMKTALRFRRSQFPGRLIRAEQHIRSCI